MALGKLHSSGERTHLALGESEAHYLVEVCETEKMGWRNVPVPNTNPTEAETKIPEEPAVPDNTPEAEEQKEATATAENSEQSSVTNETQESLANIGTLRPHTGSKDFPRGAVRGGKIQALRASSDPESTRTIIVSSIERRG